MVLFPAPISADTPDSENDSVIIINRKDGTSTLNRYNYVFMDGKEQFRMEDGKSRQLIIPNGQHTIAVSFNRNGNRNQRTFTAESQQITFEFGFPSGRAIAQRPDLRKISELFLFKGIYIGIVTAGATVEDLTDGKPIYLNANGYNSILNLLDSNYRKTSQQGTSLYYGIHRALANMTASIEQFAFMMDAVNLITFTDGLDNNSTSLGLQSIENQNFGGRQAREYQSYIKSQIESRRIFGKNITAFSIGIPGSDVTDRSAFSASLQSLASENRNFYEMDNFSELQGKFGEIARRLSSLITNMTFTVSTPSYPAGTRIRMTFDVPGNTTDGNAATNSRRYLQGEVAVNNGRYVLTNITYGGNINASAGTSVTGVLNGTEVNYTFPGFTGYNSVQDAVKQWSQDGDNLWQINSEYRLGEAITTTVMERAMIIYLVLDNSNSLQDNDVVAIREAAKSFITMLYNTNR
jgi:hypothetical protein